VSFVRIVRARKLLPETVYYRLIECTSSLREVDIGHLKIAIWMPNPMDVLCCTNGKRLSEWPQGTAPEILGLKLDLLTLRSVSMFDCSTS